ncbi:FAD-dependent oxidoreductase [Sorangium sp. So ce887]|uniref:FAD-dependent oxidoreductase n=1 Tax=Sorangium sp. So ce887 TaxID=3133324 RepID=UPI003F607508
MTQRGVRRAILVGGGIAGPVLGMFLRRLGVEVTIFEAREAPLEREGAFLGIAPNGMNVLADLGMAAAVQARGAPCAGIRFENARGRRIGVIDQREAARRFGAGLVMIRRGALRAELAEEAVRRGVEIRYGMRLTDIDRSDPREVVARFGEGGEAGEARGDVLIGCDGFRSRTRASALPEAPAPDYTGLLDFGGFARCPGAPLSPGWNVMVFGRRAFFGAFAAPGGEIWWFHNSGEPDPGSAASPGPLRERILALHQGDPGWISDVVRATPEVLGPWPLHDILTMPRWHAGRVCLIGDAAHAATPHAGQGASLAMEDGMLLAMCLRDEAEPEQAFATFERLRRPRVEAIVRQARRHGSRKAVAGPVAEWFRDRALPLFLRIGAAAQARVHAYRIDWEARAEVRGGGEGTRG